MESNSEWNPYTLAAIGLYWNCLSFNQGSVRVYMGRDKGYGKGQFKV